jgi:predicted RNA-binding Zn ribbon-like protein
MRIGDHLALDFLNSVAAPKGPVMEWLCDGRALLEWLDGANVLKRTEVERLLKTEPPGVLDELAKEAVELREWFRELLVRLKQQGNRTVSPGEITRLNQWLAFETMFPQVERDGSAPPQVATHSLRHDVRAILSPVARAMAEVICQEDLHLISRCENPACTMWFCDRTKSHRRRWCSTAICGNRAKVAAFRERKRANHDQAS